MADSRAPLDGKPYVVPSILSADFGCLRDQVAAVERGGAAMIHVDIMDGHFVPNLSMGVPIVQALSRICRIPMDIHLMIADPIRYVGAFVAAGAKLVSFHLEAAERPVEVIGAIQEAGARAGVAVKPKTPLAALDGVLARTDFILLMSVEPGFGGQKFIPATLEKVVELGKRLREQDRIVPIEVDGGVGEENAPGLVAAGASLMVAGSAIFDGIDPEATTRKLHTLIRAGARA